MLASLSALPLRLAHRAARFYVRLLDVLVPKLRRTALRNLAMALPEISVAERERVAAGSFLSIARILVSLSRFSKLNSVNIGQWIRYDGLEHFHEAKLRGKGVLFATAHLGNWELSAFAHALMTEPMHIVVRPLDNPRVDDLVTVLRTGSGNRVIEKKDYARAILRALGRNEAVGILIDQNTSLDEGAFVDFFGVPACVGTGFAKIAAHSGAAIIPGFALWSEAEQRYVLKFYPPLYASGDVRHDTGRVHAELEKVIREYPDQWLWMHRR
ncbi:MAG: lysophospholipid acyltransferase family protein, partial [Acidobacteriia bacterium]|nr:lysophospholipid acyltransferase family protein [Terriglobia bacterium]